MAYRHPIFVFSFAILTLFGFGVKSSLAVPTPDVIGSWSLIKPMPFFPVHAHLLPTGKVMIWPGDGVTGNNPWSWNPVNQNVAQLPLPGYNTFCDGHTFLANGELFVAGGHISNNVGLPQMSKYNPFNNAWTNLPNMNAGRWYPTATPLSNGDVLVVSGAIDLIVGNDPLPQVFQTSDGTLRSLTNALLAQDLYPRMLLAPDGQVFNPIPAVETRYLDTTGTGNWNFVANRVGGYRDYGSAVMYASGKVLVMGGGDPPTNTAEVIDLNQPSPSWRFVGPMSSARRQNNATLLPDGTVLVTGGTSSSGFNDPTGHVDTAELWDPVSETFTTLATSSGIPRVYHSTALLLPDGRVFSTGGNGYPDTELFSPPYLFKGARPTITSAPGNVTYGQPLFIKTKDALSITKVTMLRLSSVTHAFNMSQYISDLSFSQTTGGINVIAPPNSRVAPAGYYLLFILNGNGVPSTAKFVKLGGNSPPLLLPDVTITSLTYANGVFTSTVNNLGPGDTPAGIQIGVGYFVDGNWSTWGAVTGPLAAGGSVTIGTNGTPYNIPAGLHTIMAVVDDVNRFAEINKNNNQFTTSITVDPPPPLPDLIVTAVSYDNGVFTTTVTNQGNADTPTGTIIGEGFLVDNVYATCGWIAGPLAAGGTTTITSNCGSFTIPSGTHTITASVDDVNRIVESNETNNQLIQLITVP